MGYLQLFLFLLFAFHPTTLAQEIARATVVVEGGKAIAETSEFFICATIDWWPQDKCDFNHCSWGNSSIINLNLSHPYLGKAIKAFGRLRIRVGGSLEEQMLFDGPSLKAPCTPFYNKSDGLFRFSTGCLHRQRWAAVNHFFMENGVLLTFGLNALYGRHKSVNISWIEAWDPSNAIDLIKYTISKGYEVDSWEFGNELCGSGIEASVDPVQYGKDLIQLKRIINQLYERSQLSMPAVLAPAGFFDKDWFIEMLQTSGPGNDSNLEENMQNPIILDNTLGIFYGLRGVIEQYGPWASAWVGESGGASNSCGYHLSDTFINSFWYLDQLGMSATYNTKVYCRQTLIGGNYGLLDKDTFVPNPDYYSALLSVLWNQLMGRSVLSVATDASPLLRSYAHCSKGRDGITLLFINLSNDTSFALNISSSKSNNSPIEDGKRRKIFSWSGSKLETYREEYHLTPRHGDLRSQTMVLNGRALELTDQGDIPRLEPVYVDAKSPVWPYSSPRPP